MTPEVQATVTTAMCASGRSLAEPRLSPDGATVAFVASGAGRSALLTVPVAGGAEVVVTTEPAPRRSGGVFDWVPDGTALVYVTAAGDLRHQPVAGGPGRPLAGASGRASEPAVSPDGTGVAYTVDGRHVAVASLDPGGPWPVRLSGAPDFCVDPTWSPDSTTVAWHEWDVPAMAWDDSHIALAALRGGRPRRLSPGPPGAAGDAPAGVSTAQPRHSPDGSRLGFLCDATGWLTLWVADADGGHARPLLADDHEHGGPTWGGGQRSWVWSPDGARVALCRNEEGFGCLVVVDVAAGATTVVGRGVFTGLSWVGERLAAVRSGAATPDQLVVCSMGDGEAPARRTLAWGPVAGFEAAGLIEPRPVAWEAEARPEVGAVVRGRLTVTDRPAPGRPGAAPPLIVWVHGGPTGQTQVTFNARAAYFVDRGWNLLHVDPRGSTGWGRAYAQALRHEWGRLDIDDIAAGIRAAFEAGWGDPERTAIMGGSSGGLAVLGVLAHHPKLCAAGIDLYGVTDLIDLDDTTHRFEAHYNRSLVGPRPEADDRYRDRSPLRVADRIEAPLLVLHGTDDDNVVQAQSDALVVALRGRGATVDYHLYEGEGHGWSRPEVVGDELERIDAFLTRHVLRLPRSPVR